VALAIESQRRLHAKSTLTVVVVVG